MLDPVCEVGVQNSRCVHRRDDGLIVTGSAGADVDVIQRTRCLECAAISAQSSTSRPPGISSEPLRRRPTTMSSPRTSRTRTMTSLARRTRFSSDPPYSSSRRLFNGEKNSDSRYSCAAWISTPSTANVPRWRRSARSCRATRRFPSASSDGESRECWRYGRLTVPRAAGESPTCSCASRCRPTAQ